MIKISRIPSLILKADSLNSVDSTKNFIFHYNDTLTTEDSYLGFRSLLFKFDTTGYSKSFSKCGLVYLKNAKSADINFRSLIYIDKTKILNNSVKNPIMFYSPGDLNNPTTKSLTTFFQIEDCDISLELGLASTNDYGIWYKDDAEYDPSPNRYFTFNMLRSTGFHGIVCKVKNWNTSTPCASIILHNVDIANIIIDSISATVDFNNVYLWDHVSMILKGFNNYNNIFNNCYLNTLSIEQVESQGNGGSISFLRLSL